MKIRTQQELDDMVKQGHVSPAVAKQLQKHFKSVAASSSIVRRENQGAGAKSKHDSMHQKKHSSSENERALRESRSEYYVLPELDPNADPAVLLYRAVVKRWGRAYEGGLAVHELCIEVPVSISGTARPKRWYLDVALPTYRIAIEFDGYAHHSSLKAIKKDHRKTEHLHRFGWYVFRVGKERVIKDIDSFLDSVEALMRIVPKGDWRSHIFPGNKNGRSFNSLLLEWKLVEQPQTQLNEYLNERRERYG